LQSKMITEAPRQRPLRHCVGTTLSDESLHKHRNRAVVAKVGRHHSSRVVHSFPGPVGD